MSLLQQLSRELEGLVSSISAAVVGVEHRRGQGSGVVLAPDGYLLTNAHVVRGHNELRIAFERGDSLSGELVGSDVRTDLAVVRVAASGLRALPLAAKHQTRVGQLVVAIGNPLWFKRSVSLGVVSALDRTLHAGPETMLEGLIQTDAAINPGNSGGPLADVEGRIVGINTAIMPYAQGIGFAVPAQTASWVAAVLIQKGEIRRPFLGIAARGEELALAVAKETGQGRAVRVLKVGGDTPAQRAGMLRGDVLLSVNGNAISNIDDLQRVIVLANAREVEIGVLRGDKRHALVVMPSAEK